MIKVRKIVAFQMQNVYNYEPYLRNDKINIETMAYK